MTIKDLRVGSRVYFNGMIHTMTPEDFVLFVHDQRKFEPIPLSEHWLVTVFEFNQSKGGMDIVEWDEYTLGTEKFILNILSSGEYDFFLHTDFGHVKIEYVHQLENLCYVLTGLEL